MTRIRSFIALLTIATLVSGTTSCNLFKKNKETSTATGWNYNDPKEGGFEKPEFYGQPDGPGLVLVEGGTFVMGSTQEHLVLENDNEARRVTIRSFYIDQTEVSNLHYLEFLYWLKRVFYNDQPLQYQEYYVRQLPDTLVWRDRLAYNEPLTNLYLRYPAYRDYPVVGITWLQANEYCKWRSDRVNEKLLFDKGVYKLDTDYKVDDFFTTEAYLTGVYTKGDTLNGDTLGFADMGKQGKGQKDAKRHARIEDGVMLPNYRLPTEAEWEFAALGLFENTSFENVTERRVYPWNQNIVRNESTRDNEFGRFNANFRRGRGDYMGVAGSLNDGSDIPAPVISYFPNDYGIYNMAGNVAEWVADVYRKESSLDVSDLNPFRGNVFTAADKKGNAFQIDNNPRTADGNYNENYRRIKRKPVDVQNDPTLPFRRNYRTSDNRNYLDGDWASLREEGDWKKVGQSDSATQFMYFNGVWNKDENKFGEGATSLITDRTRVYKGGSWKDGAYFMSPSVRRYLEENLSTDYIGFRCAMDRMGSAYNGQQF